MGGISKLLSNYTKFIPLFFFLFLRPLNLPELSLASPKPSFYPQGSAQILHRIGTGRYLRGTFQRVSPVGLQCVKPLPPRTFVCSQDQAGKKPSFPAIDESESEPEMQKRAN